MDVFFSVITTVYNSEQYICKAMESVRSQTYRDFEYIIVDNGSTDSSGALIDSYIEQNQDMNIRKIYLKENKGISGGRNTGIKNARGEYVCFLDADDYWEKDKLLYVKQAINENSTYNVFCHWETHIKGEKKTVAEYRDVAYEDPYLDLLSNGNCLSTSAMTIKKELLNHIKGFDQQFVSGEEDFDCWLRLARIGAKFYMIKKPLGYWLNRDNSVSAKHIVHTEAVVRMLKPHFIYLQKIGVKRVNRIRIKMTAKQYCGCGRILSLDGNHRDSMKMYNKAVKSYPLYLKSYAGIILDLLHK